MPEYILLMVQPIKYFNPMQKYAPRQKKTPEPLVRGHIQNTTILETRQAISMSAMSRTQHAPFVGTYPMVEYILRCRLSLIPADLLLT